MTGLQGYGQGLTDDQVLGWISWYTVRDPHIRWARLQDLLDTNNLDTADILPSPPRPGDAFKRACRYSENNKLALTGKDTYVNALIRNVSTSSREIERHLILEEVDAAGKTLDFHTAAKLLLDRKTNKLHASLEPLGEPYDAITELEVDRFYLKFKDCLKEIDPQNIRAMIRKQLDLCQAVQVRSQGSVYFVPKAFKDKVYGLQAAVSGLNSGSDFHALPLVDTSDQREMIRNAFHSDVHEEAQKTITELRTFLKKKQNLTADRFVVFRNRFQELVKRAKDYAELVQYETSQSQDELDTYQEQLMLMMSEGRVKS